MPRATCVTGEVRLCMGAGWGGGVGQARAHLDGASVQACTVCRPSASGICHSGSSLLCTQWEADTSAPGASHNRMDSSLKWLCAQVCQ